MLYTQITLNVPEGSVVHSCPSDRVFPTGNRGDVAAADLLVGDFVVIDPSGTHMEVATVETLEVD